MVNSGTARILLVDDDEHILRLARYMLESHGHDVISARDGAEAISLARANQPDVILMDVLMPGMDGYTALNEIKKDILTSEIPIVMLTAIDFDMNKKLAKELGSTGYLTKPFSRKDLLETVARLIPAGVGNNGNK
jgi:two-component system alkaline phosphatase synthesis response regulator PhoP